MDKDVHILHILSSDEVIGENIIQKLANIFKEAGISTEIEGKGGILISENMARGVTDRLEEAGIKIAQLER